VKLSGRSLGRAIRSNPGLRRSQPCAAFAASTEENHDFRPDAIEMANSFHGSIDSTCAWMAEKREALRRANFGPRQGVFDMTFDTNTEAFSSYISLLKAAMKRQKTLT
jgi:hypothetical protein